MATDSLQAFDRHARGYVGSWGSDPLAREMRARVLARCAREFPDRARVLDVGCGPGLDAPVLAALGFEVVSVDASAGMVEVARSRGVPARQVAAEEVGGLEGAFSAVLSNFGALNCVDLPRFGAGLSRVTGPGAVAVLVVMGPWCLAETVALLARGRLREVVTRRRGRTMPLEGEEVAVRFWRPADLAGALPGWRVCTVEALGALVPPPDLGGRPGVRSRWDGRIGAVPLVRGQGDHTLVVLRRG